MNTAQAAAIIAAIVHVLINCTICMLEWSPCQILHIKLLTPCIVTEVAVVAPSIAYVHVLPAAL